MVSDLVHLGHKIEQLIPLLLRSLLTGRELFRILHRRFLCLGIECSPHIVLQTAVYEPLEEGLVLV